LQNTIWAIKIKDDEMGWARNLKRPFGRPWHSWEDSKIDLKELGWKGMN
jgi:hypothetical protein